MYQLVARAPQGQLLFRTNVEARALWACIIATFPEALSLALMPNHVHIDLPHADLGGRMRDMMAAFALWRNHYRGESGRVWEPYPAVRQPNDADHARRLRRYTLLNPVRAKLVGDPLEWPWSLHRECVGFGFTPGFGVERGAAAFHRYVSQDETNLTGSKLPVGTFGGVKVADVVDAVCGVTRSFAAEIRRRGTAGTMFLKTAWAHELCNVPLLAAVANCHRSAVYRAVDGVSRRGGKTDDPQLAACILAVGDARFSALDEGDLRKSVSWRKSKYAGMY